MPYSIPSDEEIRDALEIVIKRMKAIGSLKRLRELVIRELRIKDPGYTIGYPRLREIAVTSPFIHTSIEARQASAFKALKGKCPVCGMKLKPIKNDTIFGGTVTLGYTCTTCPYWTTLKRRVPTRYRFEYVKEHY